MSQALDCAFNDEYFRFSLAGLRSHAACKGQTAVFFCASRREADRKRAEHQAKTICQMCWSRNLCATWALEFLSDDRGTEFRHDEKGIWGGFTADERRRLIRESPQLVEVFVKLVRASVNIGTLNAGHVGEITDEEAELYSKAGFVEIMEKKDVPAALLAQMDEEVAKPEAAPRQRRRTAKRQG